MKTTTKRTYKHSEAWRAQHAAQVSSKQEDVSAENKEMKKVKKPDEKKLAKAEAKKLAKEKKLAARALKMQKKDFMKRAKNLFLATKKSVALTKKQSKAYGKLVLEAVKGGDAKVLEKVLNLFARIGYSKLGDDALIKHVVTVKVRLPKAKKAKAVDISESKKPRAKKAKDNDENVSHESQNLNESEGTMVNSTLTDAQALGPKDFDSTPVDLTSPDQADDPAYDEPNSIEKEIADDSDSDENEDIDIEDVDDSRNVDDIFDKSAMRDREDAFREMEEAQCDNGDWDS